MEITNQQLIDNFESIRKFVLNITDEDKLKLGLCRRIVCFDYTYDYSDSASVARAGRKEEANINTILKELPDREFAELVGSYFNYADYLKLPKALPIEMAILVKPCNYSLIKAIENGITKEAVIKLVEIENILKAEINGTTLRRSSPYYGRLVYCNNMNRYRKVVNDHRIKHGNDKSDGVLGLRPIAVPESFLNKAKTVMSPLITNKELLEKFTLYILPDHKYVDISFDQGEDYTTVSINGVYGLFL